MSIEHFLMWGYGFIGGFAFSGILSNNTPRQSRRRGSNPPPPGKKPRFPPARVLSPDGSTIGYRSINYPDPSPDRRPTNPFNGERIPNPPPREP